MCGFSRALGWASQNMDGREPNGQLRAKDGLCPSAITSEFALSLIASLWHCLAGRTARKRLKPSVRPHVTVDVTCGVCVRVLANGGSRRITQAAQTPRADGVRRPSEG